MAGNASPPSFGVVGVVLRELWGLFVDDLWLAVGVLVFIAGAWAIQVGAGASIPWVGVLLAAGLNVTLAISASRRAKT